MFNALAKIDHKPINLVLACLFGMYGLRLFVYITLIGSNNFDSIYFLNLPKILYNR